MPQSSDLCEQLSNVCGPIIVVIHHIWPSLLFFCHNVPSLLPAVILFITCPASTFLLSLSVYTSDSDL